VLRERRGELRDREDENQVKEQLERGDPLRRIEHGRLRAEGRQRGNFAPDGKKARVTRALLPPDAEFPR
jgi:hypothetical protein